MDTKKKGEDDYAKLIAIEKEILAAEIAIMQQKLEQQNLKKESKKRGQCSLCDCKTFTFDEKNPKNCSYCGCASTHHLKLKTNIDSTGKLRGLCQKKECSCAQFVSDADKLKCETCTHKAVYHRELVEEDKVVILYHGTSKESAKKIIKEGFVASTGGQLGCGVYMAREEKAERFARDAYGRGKGSGAVVLQCKFTYKRVKHVSHSGEAGNWQTDYDAVRCDLTEMSTNSEWCASNPKAVKIVAYRDAFNTTWFGL